MMVGLVKTIAIISCFATALALTYWTLDAFFNLSQLDSMTWRQVLSFSGVITVGFLAGAIGSYISISKMNHRERLWLLLIFLVMAIILGIHLAFLKNERVSLLFR